MLRCPAVPHGGEEPGGGPAAAAHRCRGGAGRQADQDRRHEAGDVPEGEGPGNHLCVPGSGWYMGLENKINPGKLGDVNTPATILIG